MGVGGNKARRLWKAGVIAVVGLGALAALYFSRGQPAPETQIAPAPTAEYTQPAPEYVPPAQVPENSVTPPSSGSGNTDAGGLEDEIREQRHGLPEPADTSVDTIAQSVVPAQYDLGFKSGAWSNGMIWSYTKNGLTVTAREKLSDAIGNDAYVVVRYSDGRTTEIKLPDSGSVTVPGKGMVWVAVGDFEGDANHGRFLSYSSETYANWQARNA